MIGKIRKFAKKLFANKYTDLVVIIVVFLSILLLAFEAIFGAKFSEETKEIFLIVDDVIIVFFVIELTLRYLSCDTFKEFFYNYWIDILAVVPLFRVFRMGRIFRLFRLFRVVSFAVLMGRHLSFFSSFLGKRWLDFILIAILLIFIVAFGTLGIEMVEKHPVYIINRGTINKMAKKNTSPEKIKYLETIKDRDFSEKDLKHNLMIEDFSDDEIELLFENTSRDFKSELSKAFWTAIFTLITGEYVCDFPTTAMGKFIVLLVMLAGMSMFAILVGASTAVMMDMFKEGLLMRKANFDILEGHIIICGWQEKTSRIIKELQGEAEYNKVNIVVISDKENFAALDLKRLDIDTNFVYLVEGDFTDPGVLRKANIDTAKTAIILPDRSIKRSNRDIDARTVLAALTIERLNGEVHSYAELLDPEYESHMKMGKVDHVVVGGYYSGLIAANTATNENLLPFIKKVLPSGAEYKLNAIPMPLDLEGKEFGIVIEKIRATQKAIPLAVKTKEGEFLLNPMDYTLKDGDTLVGLIQNDRRSKSSYLEKTFETVILSRNWKLNNHH